MNISGMEALAKSYVDAKGFSFSCLFFRDPEIGYRWVAHNLDMDIVSQGDTLRNTISAMVSDTRMMLVHGLESGVSVFRSAPMEDWKSFWELSSRGMSGCIGDVCLALGRKEDELSRVGIRITMSMSFVSLAALEPLIAREYSAVYDASGFVDGNVVAE